MVQEAVRQVFDSMESVLPAPASNTSGLVEQQMWFSGIRAGVQEPERRQSRSRRMNPLLEAVQRLQDLLERWNWQFCIIGGIALLRSGAARFTRDVDLALLTDSGGRTILFFRRLTPAIGAADLVDVESVAARRGKSLDWVYVRENLGPLAEAKENRATMDTLVRLRRSYGID
jgi:hypothetical protein